MKNKKRYFKFIIIFLILISSLQFVSAISSDKTYLFTIKDENGRLSPESLTLFDSRFSEFSNRNEGDYKAELAGKSIIIYSVNFEISGLVLPTPNPECIDNITGEVICDIAPFVQDSPYIIINLPYFATAESINVYKNEILLFSYKIQSSKGFNLNEIFDKYKYYLIGAVVLILIIVLFIILRGSDNPNFEKSRQNIYRT